MPVLGELKLRDSTVQLVRVDDRQKEFEGVYSATKHLLHLEIDFKGPSFGHLRRLGRYADAENGSFSGIGSIVFRPAGFRVEARGVAPCHRLQCWLGEGALDSFRTVVQGWNRDSLARTLDIKAGSVGFYMTRLVNEVAKPGFASSLAADAILVLALSDVAEYVARRQSGGWEKDIDSSTCIGADERVLKRVLDRICDLADVTPSVKELAELAQMDIRRLLRMFRSSCGVSLSAFVKDMRLQRARHYLSYTDMPLLQIAKRLGFSSQPNFATAFRRELGVTPHEYRRESRPRLIPARTRDSFK